MHPTLAAAALLVARATVLLCAAAAGAALLRRSGAAARHAAWTAGIVAILVLPLATSVVPAARVSAPGVLWRPAVAWLDRVTPAKASADPAGLARRVSLDRAAEGGARGSRPSATGVVFTLWACGLMLCLLRLAMALAAAHRVVRRARPVRSPGLLRIAREVADASSLRRPVRLLESGEVAVAVAVGVIRRAVLLPRGCGAWSEGDARAVLAHELGHVARRDCLTQLLASLATAVYWFHPLAWVAARRMAVEREGACDDRALAAGARPTDYAALLLDAVRASRSPLPAGMVAMARPHQVERRILAILDPAVARRPLSRAASSSIAATAAGALVLVAAVRVQAAPAPLPPIPISAISADTSRTEPDTRGDAMASPTAERLPLSASVLRDAREAGRAALSGPDSALARLLMAELDHVPTWPGDLVRDRAAWALTRADGGRLVEPLLASLSAADWRERSYAAWALAQAREPRAVPRLVELLGAPQWRLRAAAAFALDEIGDPRAAAAMARAAGDEAWQVRAPAVTYLGRLGGDANLAIVRV
ncbi:MAG TPA: M56 family metallopeptidase, partial [Longimicrobium sp.]